MYFNYRQKGIASVASIKFRGETGVGGQLLLVDAGITMQPDGTQAPPKIFSLGGQLSIGGAPVAPLQPAFVFWPCFADYSQKNDVSLRAFLGPQQVRALDERRSADGGLVFDVHLIAGIAGFDGLMHASVTVQEKVTGSDWSRILKEMKFEDRATFEVPVEGGRVGPPLDKAAAFMREALNRLELRQGTTHSRSAARCSPSFSSSWRRRHLPGRIGPTRRSARAGAWPSVSLRLRRPCGT
jgi:hypothetical protein